MTEVRDDNQMIIANTNSEPIKTILLGAFEILIRMCFCGSFSIPSMNIYVADEESHPVPVFPGITMTEVCDDSQVIIANTKSEPIKTTLLCAF